jgi:YbgC/YbaW family acyl-CoA thioester hydrolase
MHFSQKFTISIRDINYANHLDHLALLNYLHETRVRFLRAQGYSELDVDGSGGGLVVGRLNCNYRKEGFYGEEITVTQSLNLISPTRLEFKYILTKATGIIMAEASVIAVCLNAHKKIIPIPHYLQHLAGLVQSDKSLLLSPEVKA